MDSPTHHKGFSCDANGLVFVFFFGFFVFSLPLKFLFVPAALSVELAALSAETKDVENVVPDNSPAPSSPKSSTASNNNKSKDQVDWNAVDTDMVVIDESRQRMFSSTRFTSKLHFRSLPF
jgi:hypothetical protein